MREARKERGGWKRPDREGGGFVLNEKSAMVILEPLNRYQKIYYHLHNLSESNNLNNEITKNILSLNRVDFLPANQRIKLKAPNFWQQSGVIHGLVVNITKFT